MKFICLTMMSLCMLASCFGKQKQISRRPIATAGEPVAVESRPIEEAEPPQDLYTRKKELVIKPTRRTNSTGSLSSVQDPRSYLFGSDLPIAIGQYLNVKTTSNRLEKAKEASPSASSDKNADKSAEQVEQELLKALPNLDQASEGKDKASIIKSFKMEVLDVLENGDAVVMYHRKSLRGAQAADLSFKARIPQAALVDRENLSTTDLVGVAYRESIDGEIVERESANWEDEYTLRISGFDEAKSKSAVALEENRRQIKDARDKLATQIKAFGTEKQTVAKERAKLAEKEKADTAKITELETKVKEQEEKIASLTPKEEEKSEDAALTDDKNADAKKTGDKKADKKPAAKADLKQTEKDKKDDGKKDADKKNDKPAKAAKADGGAKK